MLLLGSAGLGFGGACNAFSSADDAVSDAATPDAAVDGAIVVACDPSEAPGDGVFVSAAYGLAEAPGKISLPVSTIQAGLAIASARGLSRVYVDEGRYVESLSFTDAHAGITVSGGWRGAETGWRRDCDEGFRTRTIVESPEPIAVKVEVTKAAATIGLDGLTIATRPLPATAENVSGASSIVVLVRGPASMNLTRMHLLAAKGAPGGTASIGAIGSGPISCDGLSDCGAGAGGAEGSPGALAKEGVFDRNGFFPGDGGNGHTGEVGGNGTEGGLGESKSCLVESTGECNTGGGVCGGISGTRRGTKGKCGCGGAPGAGGAPGRGGGASIAVLALGGTVAIEQSTLTTAGGGDGSPGGAGGAGADAGAPSAGTSMPCPTTAGASGPTGQGCSCTLVGNQPAAGGSAGGPGGVGGRGGKGGDGAGGVSYAWVSVEGAIVVVDKTVLEPGPGGAGAVVGTSAPSLVIPARP